VNPKTGRKEYVFANLELVYPSGDAESGYEFCFEELRAMKRGLIDPTGRAIKPKKQKLVKAKAEQRPVTPPEQSLSPKNTKVSSSRKLDIFQDATTSKVSVKMPVFEDVEKNKSPEKMPIFQDSEESKPPAKLAVFQDAENSTPQAKMSIFQDTETSKVPAKIPIFDDSEAPEANADAAAKAARRAARREEKANRTRKIAIVEVKAEPQTSE
jgi:checkpoint serine/threonine-protein kinase